MILCFVPGRDLPGAPFLGFDKIIHFSLFLIQELLLIVGFIKQFRVKSLRYHPIRYSLPLAMGYGAATEILQGAFGDGRVFDLNDMIANILGAIVAVPVFFLIYGRDYKSH